MSDPCTLCGVEREEHNKSGRRGLHRFKERGVSDQIREIQVRLDVFAAAALPAVISMIQQRDADRNAADVLIQKVAASAWGIALAMEKERTRIVATFAEVDDNG